MILRSLIWTLPASFAKLAQQKRAVHIPSMSKMSTDDGVVAVGRRRIKLLSLEELPARSVEQHGTAFIIGMMIDLNAV